MNPSARPPELRLRFDELIVDNFAGGGGASTGILMAVGRAPDLAINHDKEALALYRANHPETRILCEDVFDVSPRVATDGKPVGLAWFSPDCTFFSKARGAKPHRDRNRARRRRGLAGVVIKWAAQVRPRVICVENVEEFKEWGPLGDDGQPDPLRKGQSFKRWVSRLVNLGYAVETRELRACDYGAPTSRKRLFIVARCDGEAILWPDATHGPGRSEPYRTAAECIDWSIPCPSIFDRKKPLAPATLRRIARGIMRFVIEAKQPFIVPITHTGGDRCNSIEEPLRTITCAQRGEFALISPTLIQTGYGERDGQAPRVPGLHKPLGTIMATGEKHAVVAAFLAKHYGGPNGRQTPGSAVVAPMGTVTAVDHHALVASHLVKLKGTCKDGQAVDAPLGTVQAQGLHYAEVRAFLIKYYGTEQAPQIDLPLATVTTKDRFALVTVSGVEYAIVDIGMRMLVPRELFNAQGFPRDYKIDPIINGKPMTKTAQVHKCGNAVPPSFSRAIVQAQFRSDAVRAQSGRENKQMRNLASFVKAAATHKVLRAVLYVRVSKLDEQDPETQFQALREWAVERGWQIVGELADRVSGDPARRRQNPPGLAGALAMIERREADVLAVFAADRLVRSPQHLLQLVTHVQDMKGRVASKQDGADLDTTTESGELLVFLRGWWARMEMKLIRARTKAGMERARASGKQLGRPLIPVPDLAAVARLAADGNGRREIARLLPCTDHAARKALRLIGRPPEKFFAGEKGV